MTLYLVYSALKKTGVNNVVEVTCCPGATSIYLYANLALGTNKPRNSMFKDPK